MMRLTDEEREQAYKEFFGKAWKSIIDLWQVEDATPEEAVDILGDSLDYCPCCKLYYLVPADSMGIYHCPYCRRIGQNSESDYEAEREVRLEHDWETRNER